MWKLNKPSEDATDIFKECVKNKNEPLRTNLLAYTNLITSSASEFESKLKSNEVHKIKRNHSVFDTVPKDAWKKVYDERFVGKTSPGRKYYDKLMLIPPNERCPFCNHGVVSTLDHYLPKAIYPTLVVNPLNLVACCFDCNKIKSDYEIYKMEEATIHPYYDDIDTDIWLCAELIKGDILSFKFHVVRPESWNELLYLRMKTHFNLYNLNRLYSSNACSEIVSAQRIILKLYKTSGVEAVKAHLEERIYEYEFPTINNWRVAMYRELAKNEWFLTVWLEEQISGSIAM